MNEGFDEELFESDDFFKSRLKRPTEFKGEGSQGQEEGLGAKVPQELFDVLDSFWAQINKLRSSSPQADNSRLSLAQRHRSGNGQKK